LQAKKKVAMIDDFAVKAGQTTSLIEVQEVEFTTAKWSLSTAARIVVLVTSRPWSSKDIVYIHGDFWIWWYLTIDA
jgi:hypothetical protein